MITFGLIMTILMIVGALVGVIGGFFALFPITIEWGWASVIFDFLDVVFFLIPVYDLWPLILIIFTLFIFRFLTSVVKFILDVIPLT